ncbi:AAA family ATPase [Phenylobacterium sp.]|uniref:AAA family ATPase n=1 Tax=Phenylobacterium sp. TaxID=1871053 RepID=UPI00301E09FF
MSLRRIAGQLIDRHIAVGRRGVVICGVSAGVGVSSIAANLAIAIAQQAVSTLFVDTNLRSTPAYGLHTATETQAGLVQHLRGEATLNEIIQPTRIDGLFSIGSGGPAADADALLARDVFRDFVESIMRSHEFVIFDSPPANRFADARTIAAGVGYAVIVARRGITFLDDVSLLSEQLAQDGVRVIGTVFNTG